MLHPVIAICGQQQSGKSSAAESLVSHFDYVRIAFADPLYAMLASLLRITVQELRRLPKDQPMEGLGGQTLRHALQTLGTAWGRDCMSSRLWTDNALRRISAVIETGKRVVIDDCRFSNEFAALRDAGGQFVRIQRAGLPPQNDQHVSEAYWPFFTFDTCVDNNYSQPAQWYEQAGGMILDALTSVSRSSSAP